MAITFTTQVTMVTETCAQCGIVFGMTDNYQRRRRDDKAGFYCPSGHFQSYTVSESQQRINALTAKLAQADQETARLQRARDSERERRERAERSHSATKGELTKARKRIGNGVCPCCNRHFANLQRHMHGQHPKFVDDAAKAGGAA
jgi:DNA repair exonuclease SbcCD ATPase subunit